MLYGKTVVKNMQGDVLGDLPADASEEEIAKRLAAAGITGEAAKQMMAAVKGGGRLLVQSGGSFKVTSLEETSERIDNAFDKAISDHDKKMKQLAEMNSKEDECKCFTPSPQTNTKHSCVYPLLNLLITQPD